MKTTVICAGCSERFSGAVCTRTILSKEFGIQRMSQNVKLFYGARYNASIVDKKNQTHGASLVEHSNCPQWLFEGYEMSEKVQVSYKYYWESMGGWLICSYPSSMKGDGMPDTWGEEFPLVKVLCMYIWIWNTKCFISEKYDFTILMLSDL